MRIGLIGDILLTREFNPGLRTMASIIELLHSCDVVVGNLETVFHNYEFPPMAESGGSWLRCPPSVARMLATAGISVVSRANNHAGDRGAGAMALTSDTLDDAGIMHAGVGRDSYDAFAPRYLTTAAGRFALISLTTSTPLNATAAPAGCGVVGRPGVAYVPVTETYEVPAKDLEALQRLCAGFSVSHGLRDAIIGSMRFRQGADYRRRSVTEPTATKTAVLSVRQARACADVVAVSVHSHQHADGIDSPSEALVGLCHSLIEAGADIVACHGPHVLRAVEQYDRALIFYGLGNFMFQPDTNDRLTPEARTRLEVSDSAIPYAAAARGVNWSSDNRFWQSVVAVCDLADGAVTGRLTPVEIDRNGALAQRGLPSIAAEQGHTEIVNRLGVLSASFNTEIRGDGTIHCSLRG